MLKGLLVETAVSLLKHHHCLAVRSRGPGMDEHPRRRAMSPRSYCRRHPDHRDGALARSIEQITRIDLELGREKITSLRDAEQAIEPLRAFSSSSSSVSGSAALCAHGGDK